MRAVCVLMAVLASGCWPPMKVGGGAGGSFGGARVADRNDVDRVTGDVAATQMRGVIVLTALGRGALDRRWDLAAGWEGEWLHRRDASALFRQGFVAETAWFVARGTPAQGVRWRLGPTAELLAYGDGVGGMVGITAEYAFDKWMVASRPDAGRGMIGGIAGEMSLGIFVRGGVRNHEDADRDAVILGGVELEIPGFCFVCGASDGNR